MTLERSMIGDVHVLTPTGNVTEQNVSLVLDIVNEVAAVGPAKVVVDLGKVSWIDSIGFGALSRTKAICDNSHGWLRLARADERIKKILWSTIVPTFVFETVEEAVAAGETGYKRS